MPAHDDEDQAELLQSGGGDVDHGEDQVAEGGRAAEEAVEEDGERDKEAESSGDSYYFILILVGTD